MGYGSIDKKRLSEKHHTTTTLFFVYTRIDENEYCYLETVIDISNINNDLTIHDLPHYIPQRMQDWHQLVNTK